MRSQHAVYLLVSIVALASLETGCKRDAGDKGRGGKATQPSTKQRDQIDPALLGDYKPLPEVIPSKNNPITEAKIALGRMLFYEARLSKNHDVSCNSCHDLARHGVDNKPVSLGHRAQKGSRNSPTVYNAAAHFAQFWDGRAKDVEEQAKGPILNPVEMAMPSEAAVVAVLSSIPGYVEAFGKAFPESKPAVTYDNMAKAIGAFERKLLTPARWDSFLKGDKQALSAEERVGFNTFVEAGCPTCHIGTTLGGHIFQRLGLVKPWPDQKDLGRFTVTKRVDDKMLFKVPSLRNVEKTAPYFHDGSIKTLDRAIAIMAEHQLGRKLKGEQIAAIVAWLKTLTGEIPADYIKKPELPADGKETPKADPS